jgi:hypothetical protein
MMTVVEVEELLVVVVCASAAGVESANHPATSRALTSLSIDAGF